MLKTLTPETCSYLFRPWTAPSLAPRANSRVFFLTFQWAMKDEVCHTSAILMFRVTPHALLCVQLLIACACDASGRAVEVFVSRSINSESPRKLISHMYAPRPPPQPLDTPTNAPLCIWRLCLRWCEANTPSPPPSQTRVTLLCPAPPSSSELENWYLLSFSIQIRAIIPL